ncbi:MAG: hypothetical protein F6K21_20500 [Symploca sp. SIO2D2]|nr:hypothetical protein [Symploca sp. SIO2D2]
MNNSQPPIEELISNQNPFAGNIVVKTPQIWDKGFPDAPSINAQVSDAVFEAITQVHQKQRQTIGITITAEKGLGKSHLISRIRHRLQAQGNTLFVYVNKYDNLNQIKYQFLDTIASSLRSCGSSPEVMQWQELAAALINKAKDWHYTPQQYKDTLFPAWWDKYSQETVERLTNSAVLPSNPHIHNPYLVKAILWTLSTDYGTYATHWLSGRELAQETAELMGLPNPTREDREAEALGTVRQILDITSDYKVPVICFDELDTTDIDDNGFTTAQVVANLAKDLYNNVKGCVVLLAMYPETWRDQVKTLPQAEAVMDRLVSENAHREPITLNYLNSDDVVAVVSSWLQEFYQEHQQTPPHPLYPYEENQLREFGKQKPTVRAVLRWCAENFKLPEQPESPPVEDSYEQKLAYLDKVEEAYKQKLAYLDNNLDYYWNEKYFIAAALKFNLATLVGETVEGVTLTGIAEIEASSYLDFKIIGEENNKTVKIGVAVFQKYNGAGVVTTLKHLVNYQKFDITRGCLVRSDSISPSAKKARDNADTLLKAQGGEWVLLREEDIKPLLAILMVDNDNQKLGLTSEQIQDFIVTQKLALENHLLKDILSDPSHQKRSEMFGDGLPISVPGTV